MGGTGVGSYASLIEYFFESSNHSIFSSVGAIMEEKKENEIK
jgi:hypothetical protein